MVQREVGERLAAGRRRPGLRRAVGEGGLLGARPGGRPGAGHRVPAPAQGRVGAGRHRAARRARGARRASTPERLFALVGAGFGQRRKMLRRSLAGVVDAEAFAARRRPPRGPGRGARRAGLGPAGGLCRGAAVTARVAAGAGQAHPVAPGHRRAARRLPRDR